MILVTGAAGKTGRAVIRAMAARGVPVRGLVHRPEQAPEVEALGAEQVVVGDLREASTERRATDHGRAADHICPNMSADELAIGEAILEAARASGVEHFAYHSVLHPQVESMPHHWQKMRVEESIFASGLPFTILQPAAYMQNVTAYREPIVNDGIFPVPYDVDARLNIVDLEVVAQAASTVRTEEGHLWATYELAGPEALSQAEIATAIGRHLGRPVRAQAVSGALWRERARSSGLREHELDMLGAMFDYYERFGFRGNPRVLGWLLGRPPTTFDAYLSRELAQWTTTRRASTEDADSGGIEDGSD